MALQEMKRGSLIRQAGCEDMDQLVETCRLSFPQSLRWQSDKLLARQWWEVVLVSQAAKTWVVEEDGVITAFCILIDEEDIWAKERFLRRRSIAMYILSALRHPLVTACRVGQAWRCFVKRNRSPVFHKQMPAEWNSKMRTWIGLVAVRPHRRNAGLAGMLLEYCDYETKELGRRGIALRVVSGNTAAKFLYEKHGYACFRSDVKGDLYAKILER
ncbi:GNAT family N-acetyltransferase [Candidatus Pacearchaeota archaeon]|nr:GNAT family N-acetyltransferase [Candidatus Pacearchaeota archaeon]